MQSRNVESFTFLLKNKDNNEINRYMIDANLVQTPDQDGSNILQLIKSDGLETSFKYWINSISFA